MTIFYKNYSFRHLNVSNFSKHDVQTLQQMQKYPDLDNFSRMDCQQYRYIVDHTGMDRSVGNTVAICHLDVHVAASILKAAMEVESRKKGKNVRI